MHARHAPYYIRRVRISATDALFKMLKDQGVPYYPEVGQTMENATTYVLEFPVKAPEGAICRDDLDAIAQLEHWKVVKQHYTEHNPSVTISVGDDEWLKVAHWVYENWELVGGLSFLPRSNHVYQLAPYETITKEQYEAMSAGLGPLVFDKSTNKSGRYFKGAVPKRNRVVAGAASTAESCKTDDGNEFIPDELSFARRACAPRSTFKLFVL
jgi:hypothetical protein